MGEHSGSRVHHTDKGMAARYGGTETEKIDGITGYRREKGKEKKKTRLPTNPVISFAFGKPKMPGLTDFYG